MAKRTGTQVIAWLPKRLASRFKTEARRQGRTNREVMTEAFELYLLMRKLDNKPIVPNGGDVFIKWDNSAGKMLREQKNTPT